MVGTLKDYYMEVKYHLGKPNAVANTLSRKSLGLIASLLTTERRLLRELDVLWIEIVLPRDWSYMAALQVTSPLVERSNYNRKKIPNS